MTGVRDRVLMSESAIEKPQRDELGRFGPGNQAARGNPINRLMFGLRKMFLECSTVDEVRRFKEMLVEQAIEKKSEAHARILSDLWFGKQAQKIEIDSESRSVNIDMSQEQATQIIKRIQSWPLEDQGGNGTSKVHTPRIANPSSKS